MAEKPTVQEPIQVKEPAKPEVKVEGATADIDTLISKLDRIGIKSPDELDGVVGAARQAGRLANLLGEANKKITELETEVRTRRSAPAQEPYGTEAIDLRKEIRGVLRQFYEEDIIKPQREASERFYRDLDYVQSSEHYPVVEETWKQHFQNPNTQARLARGETDVAKEFQKIVMNTYRDIALQARDTLKKVKETGRVEPPHMESGPSRTAPKPTTADERQEQLGEIKKSWRGEDEDVDKALKVILKDFR